MGKYPKHLIVILIVVVISIWIVLPNNPGIHFAGTNKDIEIRLGLDLVGGVQALLEADLPNDVPIEPESMNTALKIVENRVNGLGVNEAVVQKAGDRRIVVELPGETDPNSALATIRQTGLLEFVDFSNVSETEIVGLINSGTRIKTDFAYENQPEDALGNDEIAGSNTYHTVMSGAEIKNVQVINQSGRFEVAFELSPEGARIFREYTSEHIGDALAIVLDKQVISAPVIENVIPDGRGVITGQFDIESANSLAVQLRYGSLPIPLTVVGSRTVGPTLGQDSLQKSLQAGLIGFSIVILFMALYYRLAGTIADVALLIYVLIAFALFKFIPVTLTLPGIAGFLLSTGSALDANILIFERIKEELRSGKNISQSMDIGWKRAWPSIRDSNIATLITCAILFGFGGTFGATFVKGFSLTLALGVGISLFTALFVTRALFYSVVALLKPTNYEKWFGI